MASAVVIRRLILTQQAVSRLRALPGTAPALAGPAVVVYDGEIPEQPPLVTVNGNPDPGGRVAPYVVAFGGIGNSRVEPDVAESATELDWTLHLLCVAGHRDDCLHLVDRVHAWMYRALLAHDGVVVGRLVTPPGYDPGPPRRLDAVKPVRFEAPLQYRLTATAD